MNSEIFKEINQHGPNWGKLHNGYFADAVTAAPLIDEIKSAVNLSNPKIIIDLAGGTGFILSELIKSGISPAVRLINLDLSIKQLDNLKENRIQTICSSLPDFKRCDIGIESEMFFIMRSALHYFGHDGLEPLLRHLRQQMKAGEFFVHQNPCFENQADADCVNKIYKMMGTGKWYPTVEYLSELLEKTGFEIESISPAPKLPLTSCDLAQRYSLTGKNISDIRSQSANIDNIFNLTENGFCAYLHYKIFTCIAV
ncbi:MAG: hypothetical protein A2Y10_15480 [Planctomycetes bacterium GWF2_41_51]|nr:MAG: hypothetical protein A2Y10_15480 [Planctomycetes bacterium GWF2_41_51]HBG27562.1 hypothetical protein [Phycisphaerales bacterium]